MNEQYQQALAAMPVEDVAFILSLLSPDGGTTGAKPTSDVAGAKPGAVVTNGDDTQDADEESRRRRHIEREWPEVGTELWAEYYGERYTADVFPANKKLKSGKQIRLTSGPALGTVCDSFSEAMIAATEEQRQKQHLGRKGVSNGWIFWQWDGKPENITGDDQEEE